MHFNCFLIHIFTTTYMAFNYLPKIYVLLKWTPYIGDIDLHKSQFCAICAAIGGLKQIHLMVMFQHIAIDGTNYELKQLFSTWSHPFRI